MLTGGWLWLLLLCIASAEENRIKKFIDANDKSRFSADEPSSRVIAGGYQPSSYIRDTNSLEMKYHDFEQMTKFLRTTSSKYPNLTALYSIGKSVQGNSYFLQ